MNYQIEPLQEKDMKRIEQYVKAYELDGTDMRVEQFLVAKQGDEILGFVRIKSHSVCNELSTLGVVEEHRGKGIGKALTLKVMEITKRRLMAVCIIPDFFTKLGFVMATDLPKEINDKINYCTSCLCVPEKYVAVEWNGFKV